MVHLQKLLKSDLFRGASRTLKLFSRAEEKSDEYCDNLNTEDEQTKRHPKKAFTKPTTQFHCFKEVLPCLNYENSIALNYNELPRVIIIGAGMAGMSAASHLIKQGYHNVVILEASNRIGGRIFTSWMGDTVIDLGADKIQGASISNPVYNLANMGGVLLKKYNKSENSRYITSSSRILEDTIVQQLIFKNLLEQANQAKEPIASNSLLDFLSLRIQQELLKCPIQLRYDSEKLLYSMARNLKSELGKEIDKVSLKQLRVKQKLPGPDVKPPQGFCTIMAQILRDIPSHSLLTNKKVTSIEWSKSKYPRALVECSDGDIYCGDFVIVTLPLGVLKENQNCLFKPELNEHKVDSICKLGVGNIGKIFLEYEKPWWVKQELNMKIARSLNELRRGDWTDGISAVEEVYNSKQVIVLRVSGDEAAKMETFSELEIAMESTNFLRKLIGDTTLPFPKNIVISRWTTDPLFYGGSVYLPIDANIGLIKSLASPDLDSLEADNVPPILFAGEATDPKHFGTVHGARISGIREAERLLTHIKLQKHYDIDVDEKVDCIAEAAA